ncbi:hypothetical protein AEB_P3143 [Altererythrobacter sp. B11]|nr:hypothetical protein AEB_P3143 [Altererythrobacter sp. B11]
MQAARVGRILRGGAVRNQGGSTAKEQKQPSGTRENFARNCVSSDARGTCHDLLPLALQRRANAIPGTFA